MTLLFRKALAGFLLLAVMAKAQYAPRGEHRPDYDRDDFYRNRGGLFDRVRADLDRAESSSHLRRGDRHRFDKVREELSEFQRTGSRHELNDAIGALQKVANDDRLLYQAREALSADLYQMREFRERSSWR